MSEEIIIGILSLPGDGTEKKRVCAEAESHIVASYVKAVEGGGGRVIPLLWNEENADFMEKLGMVNGVLFTGGRPPEEEPMFFAKARMIYEYAKEKNDAGEFFPLFGVCLGFQLLVQLATGDNNFFPKNEFDSLKYPAPLNIKEKDFKENPFSCFSEKVLKEITTTPLAYHNNRRGVSTARFKETKELVMFYDVMSTTVDRNDKVYVSTIRAKKYPIYGFQWHPEKHCYEFTFDNNVSHSGVAVQITQGFSRFLTETARLSTKKNVDQVYLLSKLINNYPVAFSGKEGIGADEIYYFTKAPYSGDIKKGTVKCFSKGFGFIKPEDGSEDVFVHYSSIKGSGFRSLVNGESVEYEVEIANDGRAKAVNVTGGSGRGGDGLRGSGCYKCGEEGHVAKACMQRGGGYGGGGSGYGGGGGRSGGGEGCYKCGEKGHFARECR